jgi:probable selenium-dependent hydroxylase accessory protein YqeC
MKLWNFRGQQNTIAEAFKLTVPEHAVICISGAGGKTSLIMAWARELASAGKKVAVTTTTHMGEDQCDTNEDSISFVLSPDPDKPGKLIGPSIEEIKKLAEQYDTVLIEADGARRMPLKWPADYEPVIPDFTDISVCVAGLSALGQPCDEVIYRAKYLPEEILSGKSVVDEQLIFALLTSPDGGRKSDRGDFRIFLNQADTKELQENSEHLQKMFAVCGIQSAWGTMK